MRKKAQLLLILCTAFTGIKAQDGGTSSNITKTIDFYPKSPEAAALSQYVDIPAGNFTGVADFSIPIYTIDFDGQQIPISLRYTTTGVKVDQIATRVGLGWTLDTGPSLSVQAIGNLDMSERRDFKDFNPNQATSQQDPYFVLARDAAQIGSGSPFDPEPDLFTYRLLNNSGKYILDRKGVVGTPIPYNQVKITGSNSRNEFEILDEQGYRHYFSSSIGSISRNTCIIPGEFTFDSPNYLINTIESPKKRTIRYSYFGHLDVLARYITSVQTMATISYSPGGVPGNNCIECHPSPRTKCINYFTSNEVGVSQIDFDGGKIIFTYSNSTEPRTDLPGEVFLKNIKVINTKGETIKDFSLEYDYFFSSDPLPLTSDPGYMYLGDYIPGMNYRLKLKKVTDNLTNGKYEFEYYETASNGKTLPIRTSNDQDFWGVYNGAGNVKKAIASSETPCYSSAAVYLNANKNPNFVYGVLGNLRKISYPTGGYTSIEYEADDFGPNDLIYTNGYTKTGTIRVKKIESFDQNNGKITREYTYKDPTTNYTESSGVIHGDLAFYSSTVKYSPSPIVGSTGTAIETGVANNPGWQTSTVNGKPVAYTYVQEHYKDESTPGNSYRKEYEFVNSTEFDIIYNEDNALSLTWSPGNMDNGFLKEEILYNSAGNRVKETHKTYKRDGHYNSQYGSAYPDPYSMGYGLKIYPSNRKAFGMLDFNYFFYKLQNTWIREDSIRVRDYDSNGTSYVETIKINNYSIPTYKHTFPTESVSSGSKGETLKTIFKYPQDIAIGEDQYSIMQGLISKNRLSDPVITKSYTDNLVTSEVRILYDQFNTGTDAMILPKYIYLKKGENTTAADRKITYDSYDTKGNLTQYTLEGGTPVSVIWGYSKTKPIAKIEGAFYDNIKNNALVTAAVTASENDNTLIAGTTAEQTEQALILALDNLRTGADFASYQMTTYSYDPAVGLKSVTPPSGIREYYMYDDAKRLQSIYIKEKDAVGNEVVKILKEYKYNYKP